MELCLRHVCFIMLARGAFLPSILCLSVFGRRHGVRLLSPIYSLSRLLQCLRRFRIQLVTLCIGVSRSKLSQLNGGDMFCDSSCSLHSTPSKIMIPFLVFLMSLPSSGHVISAGWSLGELMPLKLTCSPLTKLRASRLDTLTSGVCVLYVSTCSTIDAV